MPKKKQSKPRPMPKEHVPGNVVIHKSRIKNPVSASWDIFDALKVKLGDQLTRKHAIAVAVKKGIAFYTARTQWQEWRQAGDPELLAAEYARYKAEKQRQRELEKRLPDHLLR